jgi:hypothetical protein
MPFLLGLILTLFSASAMAEASVEYELDPYYSNIGLYVPLTEEDIETVTLKNERQIYTKLLRDAVTPRFFLIEASVNPLPVLGTWIKKHEPFIYDDFDVADDLNLIEALTEGFEEPYALSFFLGNVIQFKLQEEDEAAAVNKGYSGFLISIGDRHITNNTQISDDWYEIEWKLKGDRRIGPIYHSWSFRIGVKTHSNPEIADSHYLGIRRELFNRNLRSYRFLQNTGIDVRADFSAQDSSLVQGQLFVEKQWPGDKGIFSFGIGLKRTVSKYSGSLEDSNHETRLILRPAFKF